MDEPTEELPRWYLGRFGVTPRAEAGEVIDLPPQFLARWAYWEAQERARQEKEHDVSAR